MGAGQGAVLGADVRERWKRRRFGIWGEEQFSAEMRVAREAEQKRWADLMTNTSVEFVEAYRELQAAEAASRCTNRLCAGDDTSDPQTVRDLARLLSGHPKSSSKGSAQAQLLCSARFCPEVFNRCRGCVRVSAGSAAAL